MGDHRADIKIALTLGGKTYRMDSWINYWPDEDGGPDRRVTEFFQKSWEDYLDQYHDMVAEAEQRDTEKREREELVRLKEKYG